MQEKIFTCHSFRSDLTSAWVSRKGSTTGDNAWSVTKSIRGLPIFSANSFSYDGDLTGIDYSSCGSVFYYAWLAELGYSNCCNCFNYVVRPPDDGSGGFCDFRNQYETRGDEIQYTITTEDLDQGGSPVVRYDDGFNPTNLTFELPAGRWYRICFRVYGGGSATLDGNESEARSNTIVLLYECCQYVYIPTHCEDPDSGFTPTIVASNIGADWTFELPYLPSGSICQWSFDDGGVYETHSSDTGQIIQYAFSEYGWHKICCIVATPYGQYRYCRRIFVDNPYVDIEIMCYEPDPGGEFTPTIVVGTNNNVSISNLGGWQYEIDYGDGSSMTTATSHNYGTSGPDSYIICIKYYYNDCYYGCYCYTVLIRPCCEEYYDYNCGWINWYLSDNFDGPVDEFTFENTSSETVVAWIVDGTEVQTGGDVLTHVFTNYDGRTIDICFSYYDEDDCLRYCCFKFCLIDPFVCTNFSIDDNGDNTYLFSVSSFDASVLPIWILHRPNGDEQELGVGSTFTFDPLAWGVALGQEVDVSAQYLSIDGCYQYCCRRYCFGCHSICDDIVTLPYPQSDNNHVELEIPSSVDLEYILIHGPHGIQDSITTLSYHFPTPGTYEFCFYYWSGGQWRWCCKEYCVNDYLLCGGSDLVYTSTSSPYEYIFESCGSSEDNPFFVIDGEVYQPNDGTSLRHTFPGPGYYYVCCYYFDPVCHMYYSCCTYICVHYQPPYDRCPPGDDPPFTPTIVVDTTNHIFTLESNGASDVSWIVYTDTDSLIINSSDTVVEVQADYVDICYSYNSIEGIVWCCKNYCLYQFNEYNCLDLTYAGGLRRQFLPHTDLTPEYYEILDSADNVVFRLDGSSTHFTFPRPGRYKICMLAWNPCCYYEYCCIEVCVYDPFQCGDGYEFTPTDEDEPFAFTFMVDDEAENIQWYRDYPDGSQDLLGEGNDFDFDFSTYGGAGCYFVTASYYDPHLGCHIVCCRKICIENPYTCGNLSYQAHPDESTLTNFSFSINGGSFSQETWYLHLADEDIVIGSETSNLTVDLDPWIGLDGDYYVSVRYWDGNCWRTCCIRICVIKHAKDFTFTHVVNDNQISLELDIDDDPDAIFWDFADGNSSTEMNPIHTYLLPGTYEVCCTLAYCDLIITYCLDIDVVGDLPVLKWGNTSASEGQRFFVPLLYDGPDLTVSGFQVFYDFDRSDYVDILGWSGIATVQGLIGALDVPSASQGNIFKLATFEPIQAGDTLILLEGEVLTDQAAEIEFDFDIGFETLVLDDDLNEIPLSLQSGTIYLNRVGPTSGAVTTIDFEGIKDVIGSSTLSSGALATTSTDASGDYEFSETLDYTNGLVEMDKVDTWRNGLSVPQVARIVAHANNTRTFTDPYLLIAADFNCDGRVNVTDAISIYYSLFGLQDGPSCGPWIFIPRDFIFIDPTDPFDYDEAADLSTYAPGEDIDFVGIKKGDVLLQANTRSTQELNLFTDRLTYDQSTFEIPIYASTFYDINSFQFALSFDESKVESIQMAENSTIYSQLAQSVINENSIEIGWVDFTTSDTIRYLSDGSFLFNLVVQLKSGVTSFSPLTDLWMTETYDHVASNGQFEVFPVIFDFNSSTMSQEGFDASILAYPIPFSSSLTIEFPEEWNDEFVNLSIMDMSGKSCLVRELHMQGASTQLDNLLLGSGVYLMQIENNGVNYRKLIVKTE